MAGKTETIAMLTCRGRDGWSTSPLQIEPDMAREALNVHFFEGGLCQKRGGAQSVAVSGMSNFNALFGGYVPGQDETARELWTLDDSSTNLLRRMAAASTFTTITQVEQITAANDKELSWAVLNGKLFIAYNSASNRLKVFDPGLSTTAIRFAGLKKPATPTAATLGGAGLTFSGTYKIAWTEQRSSVTVRRSLLSDLVTVSITDDSGIRVTRSTAAGEGETHWEVYRLESGTYYLIGTVAIATTTYDDTSATVSTTTAEPDAGANTPYPSVKYLYSDGARLYGFGVWETAAGDSITPQAGTLYFSPALDASGIHDEERVSNTLEQVGRVGVSRNAGGIDRGLNGLGNTVYAFQSVGIYSFEPTGNDQVPLRRIRVDGRLGALNNESIVQGIDENGRPALYFLDPALGPYRITETEDLQWCGQDVADVWATVNKNAANKVAHATYYPDRYQVWFWVATGTSDDPDTLLMFDTSLGQPERDAKGRLLGIRGGWAKWTGPLAQARCSTLMSTSLGVTMSRDLKPYAGLTPTHNTVLVRGDTGTQDNSTNFQGYLESGSLGDRNWPLHVNKQLMSSYLHAGVSSGVLITQTALRNMGDEPNRTAEVYLNAVGSETEVLKRFEDTSVVDMFAGQIRLGDAAAANTSWILHRWEGLVETKEPRT